MEFLIGFIFLFLIDVVLSVDNAILIASTTKDLDPKSKKIAQISGSIIAVLLRFVFVIIIMLSINYFENNEIILVYALGGLFLVFIGLSIEDKEDKSGDHEKNKVVKINSSIKAIFLIVAGDIMMSFDNSFVIANFANQITDVLWIKIFLVFFALILSLVIIIFFARQISIFMKKNPWIFYIACWLLVGVGIEMIFKDPLFNINMKELYLFLISYSIAGLIVFGKWYFWDKKKQID